MSKRPTQKPTKKGAPAPEAMPDDWFDIHEADEQVKALLGARKDRIVRHVA